MFVQTHHRKRNRIALMVAPILALTCLSLQSNAQILATDCSGSAVFLFDTQGNYVSNYYTGPGGDPLSCPTGIGYGANGHLYVSSYSSGTVDELLPGATSASFVQRVASDGRLSSVVDQTFIGNTMYLAMRSGSVYTLDVTNGNIAHFADVRGPAGITVGPNGNIFVSSGGVGPGQGDDNIQEFTPGGAFVTDFVSSGSGGLSVPQLFTWHNGDLYVVSCGTDQVLRYDGTTGASLGVFADGTGGILNVPTGLYFDPDGNLFVASKFANNLAEFDSNGNFVHQGSGSPGWVDDISTVPSSPSVPEPGSLSILFSVGLTGLGFGMVRRRRNRLCKGM